MFSLCLEMEARVVRLLLFIQAVMFHFDCVSSKEPVDVHLTLKSSPVPGEKARSLRSRVLLQEVFEEMKIKIINVPGDYQTEVEEPQINISFSVVGTVVTVNFGPVEPSAKYRVCLIRAQEEPVSCEMEQTVTVQTVVFQDVKVNSYQILVQRVSESLNNYPVYVTKKWFNITAPEKPAEEQGVGHFVILIITVACVVFVAGGTTLCFCIMRRRGHCLSLKLLDCNGQYRSPESAPNNTQDCNDDSDTKLLPLYFEESAADRQMIEAFCAYLGRTTGARLCLNWTDNFTHENLNNFKVSHSNCVLLIFVSSQMELFWSLDVDSITDIDERLLCFRKLLHEADGDNYRALYVSLLPLKKDLKKLKCKDIFVMTKYKQGRNEDNFDIEINTKDLCEVLKIINDDDSVICRGLAYDELQSLLFMIRAVQDKSCRTNHISREVSGDRHCDSQQELTSRWIHRGIHLEKGYYDDSNEGGKRGSSYPMIELSQEGDQDIESVSMVGTLEETRLGLHRCGMVFQDIPPAVATRYSVSADWDAPESDVESTTCSHLEQRQVEINERYMKSVLCEGH